MKRRYWLLFLTAFFMPGLTVGEMPVADEITFSRMIIYDVRGSAQDEIAIVCEQKGRAVKVWLQDYMGKRVGAMPYLEYMAAFQAMRRIKQFALKPEYRGHLLRRNAAHGMITLAWKDHNGKQVQSIKYYAPENTLEDFRQAYNQIWSLSRYAILSHESFTSRRLDVFEDALCFLAGTGWMTLAEIKSVVAFHQQNNQGEDIARCIWQSLDRTYPSGSDLSQPQLLRQYVESAMVNLGDSSLNFFSKVRSSENSRATLIAAIGNRIRKNQPTPKEKNPQP